MKNEDDQTFGWCNIFPGKDTTSIRGAMRVFSYEKKPFKKITSGSLGRIWVLRAPSHGSGNCLGQVVLALTCHPLWSKVSWKKRSLVFPAGHLLRNWLWMDVKRSATLGAGRTSCTASNNLDNCFPIALKLGLGTGGFLSQLGWEGGKMVLDVV